ncbi:MAG: pyrimidine biosynthesis enzyme [Dehalococcoidia bacterium]|nr:pyrimidine biosynthesis enzyme [Dehalococcoidia bacterium]
MKKVITGILILISLISCSNQQEVTKVSLALDWYPNSNHAGIFYAKDLGLFSSANLEVEVYTPSDPSTILQTVGAGRDQFGISYQPDLLLARNEGVPVVAVSSIVRSPLNSIMTLGSSGISSPAELKGRTVGYPGIPLNIGILESILDGQGLTMNDIELIDVGFDLVPALLSKRVDAVIGAFWSHESILIELEGKEVNILKFQDWGIPEYHELVLVTSEDYLAKNEDIVMAFIKAFNQGFESSIKDNEAAMDSLVKAFPEVNVELEKRGIKLLSPLWEESRSSKNLDSWNKFGDWMKSKGLINSDLDIAASFNQ